MSGSGPPHHPHNRQVPNANTAWNHLQVPNYYPRQPQVAHMSTDHSLLHQPTWHTPTTTDAMKIIPHTHMLTEMLKNESLFPRDCVDLSLTRNGNQNGEIPTTPISLSVRDTNKINSLPPSVLDIQTTELSKCTSPSLKAVSPGLKQSISPGLKSSSPGLIASPGLKSGSPSHKSHSPAPKAASPGLGTGLLSTSGMMVNAGLLSTSGLLGSGLMGLTSDPTKSQKRSNIRVDSILERLNPTAEKVMPTQELKQEMSAAAKLELLAANKLEILSVSKPETATSVTLKSDLSAVSKIDAKNESTMSKLEVAAVSIKPVLETKSETVSALMNKSETKTDSAHEKVPSHGVIVPPTTSFDENSNSSSIVNVPTSSNIKEDDSGSMHSNEDSLDSTKSRRKRKPSKTVRVSKEDEVKCEKNKALEVQLLELPSNEVKLEDKAISSILEDTKIPERRHSSDDLDTIIPAKTRRKASSESETIDNIAAMVQEGLKKSDECQSETIDNIAAMVQESIKEKEKDTSETIDNIAAMVQEGLKEKQKLVATVEPNPEDVEKQVPVTEPFSIEPTAPLSGKPVTVSVIKSKKNLAESTSNSNVAVVVASVAAETTSTSSLVMTPAQKKATNTHFVEVENKLEEMFAGIVEDPLSASGDPLSGDPLKTDSLNVTEKLNAADDHLLRLNESVTSTSQDTSIDVKDDKKASPKKGKRNRTQARTSSDVSLERTPKKKRFTKTKHSASKSKKNSKSAGVVTTLTKSKKLPPQVPAPAVVLPKIASKSDTLKDVYAYDSGSNASSSRSRGPFVQIKGPRDSPISVSVVNTPLGGDEDGDRKPLKAKKFHDDSEYRHKVRSKGLHCSTLSNKYDAQTKDATWICAFCKRGPHASELTGPSLIGESIPPGDLFGPYIITTQCPEFERRLDDPYDRQFKSKKIGRVLDAKAVVPNKSKKSKRKHSESGDPTDVYLGITDTGNNTYEVWAHEDCLVWSPGIYLVGPKLVGLEEAVWSCCNVPCLVCNLKGSNICCIKRGCLKMAHLCCARASRWRFDDAAFKAYCPEHTFP
ncbi:uncharacterized protein CG5098 [Cylas formicarius]|uniref:uncharacterized protein CG5098 n=1 Tax=Cylas formicarius TaxID=197179 RepID=UPI002958BCAC|nr:uncharacterized protein CG5098 [Cylas formicarius]